MSNFLSAECPVFLSYSHDSPAHKRLVLDLAQQLRAHGIEANLDQFINGHPEQGWPRWMEHQIKESAFVLVVCTEAYRRRFDGDELPDRGLGANWEAILTRQELYDAQGRNKKFIPVVLNHADRAFVPAALRQYTVYRLMDDYTALLRVLLDQPSVVAAPIGPLVRLSDDSTALDALAASPNLPLPLAQTLLRCINAKTGADAWLAAHHFFDASIRLIAVSQLALYSSFEPESAQIDARLDLSQLSSSKYWLDLLGDVSSLVASQGRPEALEVFGDGLSARLTAPRSWKAAEELMRLLRPAYPIEETAFSARDLFRVLLENRAANAPSEYPSETSGEQALQCARLIRDAVLEALQFLQPFGACRLAVGTYGSADTGGAYAYQYLSLNGDGLRLPLAAKPFSRQTSRPVEGTLWWVGPRGAFSLYPFAVLESSPGVPERVGFLHLALVRAASSGGSLLTSRKLAYLDFHSGDYLQTKDAGLEVSRFLEKLWGREVSPAEIRARAAETPAPAKAEHSSNRWMGDFEILHELGRGAMGIVYKARQGSLGRIVALKVLPHRGTVDALALRRFQLEIEALGRCDHPNVVKVLTAGHDLDYQYYAMEFVEGSDLAHIYSVLNGWHRSFPGNLTEGHLVGAVTSSGLETLANATNEAPLNHKESAPQIDDAAFRKLAAGKSYYTRIAEIMADAARGVQHLHDNHLLHRDLKPANLMLSSDGRRAIVMDLGLVKATDSPSLPGSSLVMVLGTLRYMAPEQLQRKLIDLTPQADIYGLGATLYELACLTPIFDGDSEARLTKQVLFEQPVDPWKCNPKLPRPLGLIIQKATAKDPGQRYATALQLAEDLDSFALNGFTVHAKPPTFVQRARRVVVANKIGASIAAAALILLAVGAFVWDYNRVKTADYANVIYIRQVPVGFGPLSKSQASRKSLHVELQFKRRRVIVERLVNSAGRLDNNSDAPEVHYFYRADGTLERAEEFDHHLNLRGTSFVSPDATVVDLKDQNSNTLVAERPAIGPEAVSGRTQISKFKFEYNRRGLPTAIRFQDNFGNPKPGLGGLCGRHFEFTASGLVASFWDLNAHFKKMSASNGVSQISYERNEWGDATKMSFLTYDGYPAVNDEGMTRVDYTRDDVSNEISARFLGPGYEPVVGPTGCAGYRSKFDKRGFRVEHSCLNVNGEPDFDKNGFGVERNVFDARGNIIESRNVDPHTSFSASSNREKLVLQNQGFAIVRRKYDSDNMTEESFFGIDDKPTPNNEGYHRTVSAFSKGRRTRIEQYGTEGKLVRTDSRMPILTFAYDDNGHQTDQWSFDESGKPANDKSGMHHATQKYDERGNLTEVSFFDSEGRRVVHSSLGFASRRLSYDSQGNQMGEEYFGPDDKPMLLPDGYHSVKVTYDGFGRSKSFAYFDTDGKPVLFQNSYQSSAFEYNDRSQVIKVEFFGINGEPVSFGGAHRQTREYNARGNQTEEAYFGTDDSPVSVNGRHLSKMKYDSLGRRVELSYFGVHNEPVQDHGVHTYRYAYDSQGHITENSYFGIDDQPCNNTNGFHKQIRRYDERGHVLEESYFASDGSPTMKLGFFRSVNEYDERGNLIEQRFYDVSNNLTLSGGRAVVEMKYDLHGNEREVAYYGTNHQLVRRADKVIETTLDAKTKRREGVAKAVYAYDSGNRITREEFFGPDDKPIEDIYGAAKVFFVYSDDGKRTEKWQRLNGSAIRPKNLEPPTK